jgi:lipopolysaccharide/colanic/teichoic acid biosynthesis glycosyltransferase
MHARLLTSLNEEYLNSKEAIPRKSEFLLVYIGKNLKNIDFISQTFNEGFCYQDYAEAEYALKSLVLPKCDIVVIDLPFEEARFRRFCAFLKTNSILSKVPVVYNEKQLVDKMTILKHSDVIDDVIDLNNWQYDFDGKISFLKKIREYAHLKVEYPVQKASIASLIFKRGFDIMVSLVLLLLLTPVLLLIAIAIKMESKGPIFYNSKRAGKGFKIFNFYKFRTMAMNADKKVETLSHLNQYNAQGNGPRFFKISNDPRITKVGKFLRNTSLDELPQLLNVLKGDMSLVGNRPLPLYEAATLTTDDCVERFMAPAGITGLWQIKKRGNSEMSVEERISLDICYARKSNLIYDFWIMANTPSAIFQKDNV